MNYHQTAVWLEKDRLHQHGGLMVAMKCQKGTTNCGLFSIATMTSLVLDEDLGTVNYNQRTHLVDCMSQGKLFLFPKAL